MQQISHKYRVIPLLLGIMLLIFGAAVTGSFLLPPTPAEQELPVLMYHHFDQQSKSQTVVSQETFRRQIEALKNAGYETVNLQQIKRFVCGKGQLPQKPILITMDDGYRSNLEIAAPILEEFGMCATVFVVGISEGEVTYVHTGAPFEQAHFSYEEALPWIEKGIIDVQCHTFDMHQLERHNISRRDGMLQMKQESDADYLQALRKDFERFRVRRSPVKKSELLGMAYPYGYYNEELDALLEKEIDITFTIDEHTNLLKHRDRQSMRMLGRWNVTDQMTGEEIIEKITR